MIEIKASCPICGEVSLVPDDIRLWATTTGHEYAFTCPTCQDRVSKPAIPEVIVELAKANITPEPIPAEALEDHGGPALSWDDVLDFADSLGRTDFLSVMADAR